VILPRFSIRTLAIGLAVSFGVFVLACYLIAVWHAEISRSMIATYAVVGMAGISALVWPLLAVRLAVTLIRRFFRTGL
jgi:hypothetical protein